MTHPAFKAFGSAVMFSLAMMSIIPTNVHAATTVKSTSTGVKIASVPKNLYIRGYVYHDEKVVFEEANSRCLTSAIKGLHDRDVKQLAKDADTYDVENNPELAKAFEAYQTGLDMTWDAMKQPYCGYGSHGVEAAQKSYLKTTTRLRATFLAQVKKIEESK